MVKENSDEVIRHLLESSASYDRQNGGLTLPESVDGEVLSGQASQWSYNNGRCALSSGIEETDNLLRDLENQNDLCPVSLPGASGDHILKILGLQLTVGGSFQKSSGLDLDRGALATLFKSRLQAGRGHLGSLQRRVDDISSKVFITGDLNTGKSNFCNSLLKHKLLPEDQLPCTNVFSEVVDARSNGGVEEVHAILCEKVKTVKEANDYYNPEDISTYEKFGFKSLQDLVLQNDKYILLKIYYNDDKREPINSLLRNGSVNISLIDSPGLNMDSIQTAEVMARQEEIDLVIFVVNAENQLTLSAKEFITLASKEKKLMFFVIKKFDKIRDKDRCKKLILDQIQALSPETHKRASEFVHFLEYDGDFDRRNGNNNNGSSDDENDNENNFPENNDPNFDHLENSLRNFILKKRALSKLLPAKTYLIKILTDVETISAYNLEVYDKEDMTYKSQLEEIQPQISKINGEFKALTTAIDKLVEKTSTDIIEYTNQNITNALDIPFAKFPKYEGISQIHDYVFNTNHYISTCIRDAIRQSEKYAKIATNNAVSKIDQKGKEILEDDFMSNRIFDSDLMFAKKTKLESRQFVVSLSLNDLLKPSWNGFTSFITWSLLNQNSESTTAKTISTDTTENKLTSALGLGDYSIAQYCSKPSLVFTSKIPTLAVCSLGSVKIARDLLIQGFHFLSWNGIYRLSGPIILSMSLLGIVYLIHDIPRALPKNLLEKYKLNMLTTDYIHSNAVRISNEARQVLKVPVREIIKSCNLVMDKKQIVKRELEKKLQQNKQSKSFFVKIHEKTQSQKAVVSKIALDL